MREGWKKVNLDNSVVEIIDGDRGSNYPKQDEFFDKGYCLFLNTGNVTVNGFNFEKTQFVTKEKDDLLRKGKLRRNDIVLTTRGTVGNVAYYDDSVPFDNVRINSGMVILRIDSEQKELYTKYFSLFLKSALFKEQVLSHVSGSAQPQLPIKDMKQIELTHPPYETQRRIAAILSSLDDKIELNRQTNQTLEAIAQALFKEWFVDFNFPGTTGEMQESELGSIPVGWSVGKLGEIISFKNGKSSPERDDSHDYPVYGSNGIIGCASNYNSTEQNIVIGRVGSFCGAVYLPLCKTWITDNAIIAEPKTEETSIFCFMLLQKLQLNTFKTGSGQPLLNQSILSNIDVLIPVIDAIVDYDKTVAPIFQQLRENERQSAIVSTTRDTLLPKLMNGEIAV